MRFSVDIKLEEKIEQTQLKYMRQHLQALIKEAVKNSDSLGDCFLEIWSHSGMTKPYTFSAFYPQLKSLQKDNFIRLFISSSDPAWFARIYNGLLKIRSKYLFLKKPLSMGNFYFLPLPIINEGVTVFKTMAPIVLRNPANGDEFLFFREGNENVKPGKYWVQVSMDEWTKELEKQICFMVQGVTKQQFELKIRIEGKMQGIFHGSFSKDHGFKLSLPGFTGLLHVDAPVEVKRFIYDLGVGSRRNEGFGMLDLLK